MAKPALSTITTSQTFQNWFDKTNEVVTIFRTDAITASGTGDTTTGDATLIGDFTSTNLIASTLLQSDTIASRTGGATINFNSDIKINGASQTTAEFSFGSGGQVRFTDGSLAWDVGLENSNPGNFIIDTGTAPTKFQLSTAGTLSVPNIIVGEDLTVAADAEVTGTLTVGTLQIGGGGAGLSTDDVSEGSTNLYYTDARARGAFSGGDGINISNAGVISFDGDGELQTYTGNEFILTGSKTGSGNSFSRAFIDGSSNVGVGFGRLRAEWATQTYDVLTWVPSGVVINGYCHVDGGDVRVDEGDVVVRNSSNQIVAYMSEGGNGYFTGDVTTYGAASDERLKENIEPIDNALAKVLEINGYTFNYKDNPEERLPGVIAQEIEKVLPEVVYNADNVNGDEEEYKAVRYAHVVPLLIEAIKELTGKVNDLENRLANGDNS